MISIGLIGCGAVVHSNYAKTLVGRSEYRVRYVCDTDSGQAASAAALFDAETVSLATVASSADAIIISTPPSTHAAIVRACLTPDRIIICEKPYMTTRADAREISASALSVGARLYVGHFRRTFPQLQLARTLVASGLIGDIAGFAATEGGRFTWNAVSGYTTRDPHGGVLWDTGSHTLDMALFASCLDETGECELADIVVDRDKPEPSHDFRASFILHTENRPISARLHVSRKQLLRNFITLDGTRGRIDFLTDLDDRVRCTTKAGSTIMRAEDSHADLLECLDLELRSIFAGDAPSVFAANRFRLQIAVLDELSNAT